MTTTTHFGFEDIPTQEKTARVRGVFDAVASRYDLMNDAMSAGTHRLWKRAMVARVVPHASQQVLDLAGGTGDIAERIQVRVPQAEISLADINPHMLEEGRNRAIDAGLLGFRYVCANAEHLPFADRAFDTCTIAFGIRNVTHIQQALAEIYRVLKPGGQFLCLEFSTPTHPWLKRGYDWYSFHIIPGMGEWLAGERAPYQYLVESIRRFPAPEAFAAMLREAGFQRVRFTRMSGGIVALHEAWRV